VLFFTLIAPCAVRFKKDLVSIGKECYVKSKMAVTRRFVDLGILRQGV